MKSFVDIVDRKKESDKVLEAAGEAVFVFWQLRCDDSWLQQIWNWVKARRQSSGVRPQGTSRSLSPDCEASQGRGGRWLT